MSLYNEDYSNWKDLHSECRKDLNDIEMQIDDIRLKLSQDIINLPVLPYDLIEREKELQTLQQNADCLNRLINILTRNIQGVET